MQKEPTISGSRRWKIPQTSIWPCYVSLLKREKMWLRKKSEKNQHISKLPWIWVFRADRAWQTLPSSLRKEISPHMPMLILIAKWKGGKLVCRHYLLKKLRLQQFSPGSGVIQSAKIVQQLIMTIWALQIQISEKMVVN